MAVSRGMRRLLSVLEAQEERYRAEMETARKDLNELDQMLAEAADRERGGRQSVTASALTNELAQRIVGLEEVRAGRRQAELLQPRIADAEARAGARREEFLSKRIERRQAETAVEKAEVQEAIEAGRRGQQALDDWFLGKARQSQITNREE